jgi:hypothetical protein
MKDYRLHLSKRTTFALLAGVVFCSAVEADIGPNAPISSNTISPNKRYGVTIPQGSAADQGSIAKQNDLIELSDNRVLGRINADTAFAHMNNLEILPGWWSSDDSYLLWQVKGPWGMYTQMLICLKGDKITWELDVLRALQRAILTKTEAIDPEKFLAAMKANWGNGSAYPETFTVDSHAENANQGPLIFPVRFHVYLTSNPKGADGVPEVDSSMEATLSQDGAIAITEFHDGKSQMAPWNEVQAAGHE